MLGRNSSCNKISASFEENDDEKKSSVSEEEGGSINTEDSLLSSKSSSETISRINHVQCCKAELKSRCRGPKFKIISGLLFLLWGICTIIWPPLDVMMDERLRMRPGFPPYEWWKNPPDEVLLRVYIFNITNSEQFLNGEDSKLNLQEIGPIIFREKLFHTNVQFHENDTMTYVASRKAIFLPERNHIDLNKTITVPNLPVLGMASTFYDATIFEKWAFNMLVNSADSNATVTTTIYNYLWNFSDPIVELAKNLVPSMVPVNNLGILSRIYDNFQDNVTVYIGTENGHEKYFLIDRYDGSEFIPGHEDSCEDTLINSTEGVAYPQYLTKKSPLNYWRKTMCQVTTLHYESEHDFLYGVKSFKFTLPNSTYDRTSPEEKDCYKSEPVLQNGLSDVSKCYYDFPIAASFPHFLHGDPKLRNYVTGLEPNETKHGSFVYVEPMTGIPLNSRARSQSNLILRTLDGFNDDIEKFSDLVLPMFWAEYNQEGLPWYIASLMYFTVNIMPYLQRIFTAFIITLGFILIISGYREMKKRKNFAIQNKLMLYEHEVFIKV